ncbi:uncharacterized protein BCR38DRAFT_348970 [Pseudomassariella vexata]|uniref:WSC domain-containing protein n=1 Tax=Pseudomassariella vexata TaxID=1141098 RepID=A0A1Y2DNR7_9PEZI|nr:uncharacterized protein BCR38DRAFT_348970 [Pseudomassariella vexata]ORY60847.1 hypothetical protein BCR38DRAFT_348970 [Pseudomassariella vexata]
MSLRLRLLSTLLVAFNPVWATGAGEEVAATDPILGTDTVHGCYSSLGSLVKNATIEFNSQGSCAEACRSMGKYVGASNANDCYCGDKYPPLNTLVDDSECTEPCPGFGAQACGGIDTYTVYNTGVKVSVADSANLTTSSSSSSVGTTSTTAAAVVTVTNGETTTVPTETPPSEKSSGTNTVSVAVGVVVGVVAIIGVGGGIFLWMRRKRNQEIEDEHRRNAAVNAFIAGGGKPPGSSGGLSISDQRLDPVMAQRRMSSGSIADNEDYSRRILRVCNSDITPVPSSWSNKQNRSPTHEYRLWHHIDQSRRTNDCNFIHYFF